MAQTIWTFNTKSFTYKFNILPDYDVDLSFDDSGEVRDKINKGLLECFIANIQILFKDTNKLLAEDYLGGCIYENPLDFIDHRGNKGKYGSYFKDMIISVNEQARLELKNYKLKLNNIYLKG